MLSGSRNLSPSLNTSSISTDTTKFLGSFDTISSYCFLAKERLIVQYDISYLCPGLFTFTVLPIVNLSLVLADNGLITDTSVFPLDEIVGIKRVGFLITRSVTCPCGLGIKRTPIPIASHS